MLETIAIIAIVATAGIYLLRGWLKSSKRGKSAGCGGCSGCSCGSRGDGEEKVRRKEVSIE